MASRRSNPPEEPAARPKRSAATTAAGKAGAGAETRSAPAKGRKPATAGKPTTARAATRPEGTPGKPAFPIVGVGASAGGLETFSQLLQGLPPDTGMAYVLIQHLDPKHESMLTGLLARTTPMPVVEASDGLTVEPNHVYVIPPDTNLGILHGSLHLMPRGNPHKQHLPVDYFLRSLAEDQGARAIGVILSGTASDGALGLKAVKAEGGITLAQDPASAKYDGMPRSAIATGGVDLILSVEGIARELARLAGHPYVAPEAAARPELPPEAVDDLSKVFLLLRGHTGSDFTYYKQSTIQRRIKRRMLLHKLERLKDYVRLLQQTPAELDALFQDILISVTSFFRDPATFEALERVVFPRITEGRSPDNPIRVWVAGCSSGEEAYSVAIALLEFLGDQASGTPIQIFATDIDAKAIDRARAGVYPESIASDLSPMRLQRCFVRVPQGYQIDKAIRDMCVFAVQNVIKDPPFSRLDLAVCRNLLIYFGSALQKKVLQVFHYALKPSGFLMLGTSETVGGSADLFALADRKNKIYTRKAALAPLHYQFAAGAAGMLESAAPAAPQPPPPIDVPHHADRIVLSRYGPPGVIIDQHLNIQHFRGQTGPFIEPAPGTATLNLAKMARQELMVELRTVAHKAITEGTSARKEGVKLRHDGESRTVDIQVIPIQGPASAGPHFLVLFEEGSPPAPVPAPGTAPEEKPAKAESGGLGRRLEALEDELAANKEYMQSVIEEQEVTNEELQSANEEIQSANEELQSTNEELETAKEELQSTNEELATVNEELENRNLDLTQANSDLHNLLNSIDLPVLMLGEDLRIRHFTPPAKRLLNLIASDVGRPISDITPRFDLPDLGTLTLEVIDTISPRTVEVRDPEGHWFSLRLRPYKTLDKRIAGAVLVSIDITEAKSLAQERLLAAVVRDSRDAIMVQDLDGGILAWNPRAEQLYGYTEAEALALNIMEIIPEGRRKEAKDFVQRLRRGEAPEAFETQRFTKEGRVIDVWLTASLLVDDAGNPRGVATTEREMGKR
jgi:two-component system CheB/CheR fusion protein